MFSFLEFTNESDSSIPCLQLYYAALLYPLFELLGEKFEGDQVEKNEFQNKII